MSSAAPVLLAGLGGAAVVVALREWGRALPALAGHLAAALGVIVLAGSENRAASERERRRIGLLCGAVLGAVLVFLTGSRLLAVVAVAGPTLASWVLARRHLRYRRRVEEAIPVVAEAIADSVAAGGSLRVALMSARFGLEGPAAVELARVSADLEVGLSPRTALYGLARRIGSERLDSFVASALSQERTGGDLARLLRRHADAAIDRGRAEKEARSATAQARMTGGMVVGMPIALGLVVEAVAPGFTRSMLADPIAAILLAAAAVLQIGAFLAIRTLGKVR
jgi:tight adherence protein B